MKTGCMFSLRLELSTYRYHLTKSISKWPVLYSSLRLWQIPNNETIYFLGQWGLIGKFLKKKIKYTSPFSYSTTQSLVKILMALKMEENFKKAQLQANFRINQVFIKERLKFMFHMLLLVTKWTELIKLPFII